MENKKTLKNKRFYLTFLDENGDEITLSFRTQKSLDEFINSRNDYRVIKIENKRPSPDFANLSKREVEGLEKLVSALHPAYDLE
jgi:hypothetical protein